MKRMLVFLFILATITSSMPLKNFATATSKDTNISSVENVLFEEITCKNELNDSKNSTREHVVITYGTFDLLHYGHINILKRAKSLGDYLVVALSTDEFNWNKKQKKCYFNYEQRKLILEAIKYVDLVVPEDSWEQKRNDMHKYNVSKFVMGDDWLGEFDYLKEEGVEVIYLPRTPDISTTQIKQNLCVPN